MKLSPAELSTIRAALHAYETTVKTLGSSEENPVLREVLTEVNDRITAIRGKLGNIPFNMTVVVRNAE